MSERVNGTVHGAKGQEGSRVTYLSLPCGREDAARPISIAMQRRYQNSQSCSPSLACLAWWAGETG